MNMNISPHADFQMVAHSLPSVLFKAGADYLHVFDNVPGPVGSQAPWARSSTIVTHNLLYTNVGVLRGVVFGVEAHEGIRQTPWEQIFMDHKLGLICVRAVPAVSLRLLSADLLYEMRVLQMI